MAKETLLDISALKTHYFIGSKNVTSISPDEKTGSISGNYSSIRRATDIKPLTPCFDFDIIPPEKRTDIDHTTGQDQKPNP